MPAPDPPEFRRRAVELARLRNKPVREIAKDLGIVIAGSPAPAERTPSNEWVAGPVSGRRVRTPPPYLAVSGACGLSSIAW
jgi:transposase-like protein